MSSSPLIGPHSTRPGPRRVYKDWALWAEDGYVFMEDQVHGTVKVLMQREALDKLMSFAREADVWDRKKQEADPQKRAYAIDYHGYLRQLVEILRETIGEAKQQGDPTNPEIRKRKLREFLRSRSHRAGGVSNTTAVMNALDSMDNTPIIFTADSDWLARGPEGVDERR